MKYNPNVTLQDKEYVESDRWKCEKSLTGAHWWVGHGTQLECVFCYEVKEIDYRTAHQIMMDERKNAKNNSKLHD